MKRALIIGTLIVGSSAWAAPQGVLSVDTDAPFVRFAIDGKTLDFDEQGRIKQALPAGEHELAVFRVFGKPVGTIALEVEPGQSVDCFWYRDEALFHCESHGGDE